VSDVTCDCKVLTDDVIEPVKVFTSADELSRLPIRTNAEAENVFSGPKLAEPTLPASILANLAVNDTSLTYNSEPEMFKPPKKGSSEAYELPELNINEPESSDEKVVI